MSEDGRVAMGQASSTPATEMQMAVELQERCVSVIEQWSPVLTNLPEMLQRFGDWAKSISERIAPVLIEMAVAFQEMPPRLQSALLTLGESGWYLDGEQGMSELWDLEALLLDGKVAEVDLILTQHYEERLSDIESYLVKALPNREKILRVVFSAHRRGEFELSVPVLLAQSDGICKDLTGYQLFMKAGSKPQVAQYVAIASDAVSAAMLSPLSEILPINASEKERNLRIKGQSSVTWQELNRHLVLHGESLDYGTQVNSLKAVSLITYLVSFLGKAEDAPS